MLICEMTGICWYPARYLGNLNNPIGRHYQAASLLDRPKTVQKVLTIYFEDICTVQMNVIMYVLSSILIRVGGFSVFSFMVFMVRLGCAGVAY